jgi:antitoxin component YwqK of YwqJK toxin-antitoxin module
MSIILALAVLAVGNDDLRELAIPADAIEQPGSFRQMGTITKKRDYFVDDALVGERLFYQDGRVADEKIYRDGKLHGIWRQYWPSGKLFSERPYRDGQMDGTFRFWNERGTVVRESVMKNGTGLLREYPNPPLGSSDAEINYVDGMKHGLKTLWGKFKGCEGYGYSVSGYKNDKLDGWEHTRDEDGTLIGYGYANQDRLHGVQREFERDGTPRSGFPKYYINGEEVSEAQFMETAKTDKVLAETLTHSPPRTEKPPRHDKPASELKGLSVSDVRTNADERAVAGFQPVPRDALRIEIP